MYKHIIVILALCLCLSSCAPVVESVSYSPYYFVTVGPDATATPTPFQPYVAVSLAVPQATQSTLASPTLPLQLITATPLPTSTLPPTVQPTPEVITQPQPVLDDPETVTFLLLGSDTRGGASFRTDTILIGIVRPRDGQVSLISVPRDLWVNIPTVGMQRINTAYQFGQYNGYSGGGAALLKDTILYNLGLQIDHTAMIDFNGFRSVVDTLGGIDLPISCPYTDWRLLDPSYDPQNENNWFLYTAGPGLLHMDGDLALWYARSRKKSNDFDRGRRQQEVIRAIYGQALRTDSISRIPQLYTDLSGLFTTDLGLADLLKLSPLALHLTNANIRSYYIAGDLVTSWITPGGAYVLLPNTELIQQMLNQAMSASPRQQEREAFSVEIQNGSSYDGWDALAAERLNYAGFKTSFKAADNRSHATSLLYDLTSDQDRNRSAGLLAVLGLPDSALVSVPSNDNKVSFVLIVGEDYQACFDPAGLTP
jgi:polyisoprenyl-teichoic acid--peptidoglycan teichoic acid transferase